VAAIIKKTKKKIKNKEEACDRKIIQENNKDVEDMLEKNVEFFFSPGEARYCVAENVFVKKLEKDLEDGILFFWCVKWSFDPGMRNRFVTSIPPSTQPLKMQQNFLVLSSFVLQSLTKDCVIFVMWKHRWRWKTGGEPCQWVEEHSFRSKDLVVHDLMRDERVRSKGLVIRKRLHLMLYNSMYRMMLEAKFESQEDPLLLM